jgi:hypothetical protein
MRIRIVSYDMLTGGVGRADPIAEVLLAQLADVIALLEADDQAVLRRLSMRLEMPIVHAQLPDTQVAVASRWPIVQSVNHAITALTGPSEGAPGRVPAPPAFSVTIDADGHEHSIVVAASSITSVQLAEIRTLIPKPVVLSIHDPIGGSTDGWIRLGSDSNQNQKLNSSESRSNNPTSADPIPSRIGTDLRVADSITLVETWIESDRLAVYASDHLPRGATIEC